MTSVATAMTTSPWPSKAMPMPMPMPMPMRHGRGPRLQPAVLLATVGAHAVLAWGCLHASVAELPPQVPGITWVSTLDAEASMAAPAMVQPPMSSKSSSRPSPLPAAAPPPARPAEPTPTVLRSERPSEAPMVPATTTPTPKAAADTSGAHTAAVANAMAASTTPTSSTSPGTAAGPLNEPALTAVTAPRFDADYLDNPRPAYPPLSRKANEQGKVVLWVSVDATGAAREVAVRSSSGFERLDRAAQAAVSRWRFVPARQGQMPVAATVLVPIVFSFKD